MDVTTGSAVGIDRLPGTAPVEQQKESMNCKSCRKKKVKCNRLKPSCNSCLSFQCPCIYDAIPKKRGPKTEPLDNLIKRVSSIEREMQQDSSQSDATDSPSAAGRVVKRSSPKPSSKTKRRGKYKSDYSNPTSPSSSPLPLHDTPVQLKELVDLYFSRVNGRPVDILDRDLLWTSCSQDSLPDSREVVYAAAAVAVRFQAMSTPLMRERCEYYAGRSRSYIDMEDPSLENVQALLLLSVAYLSLGKGKKSYMLLGTAIRMSFALDLHRELPRDAQISEQVREARRKCFWACYMMDRLSTSGSNKPHVILDDSVSVRYPMDPGSTSSCMFSSAGLFASGQPESYGARALCVEIMRLLGRATRYLQEGGAKGESHLPWHPNSTLYALRKTLDAIVAHVPLSKPIEAFLEHQDGPILVFCKEVYHLIHCILYRQFMPLDLRQLGNGNQDQLRFWQIEATKIAFAHANEIGMSMTLDSPTRGKMEWGFFTLHCISNAAAIHIHGVHYDGQPDDPFYHSRELLAREMCRLRELRHLWFFAEADYEILQELFVRHGALIRTSAANTQSELQSADFFARYAPHDFDFSHFRICDLPSDFVFKGIPFENSLLPVAGHTHSHGQETSLAERISPAPEIQNDSAYDIEYSASAEALPPTVMRNISQPPQTLFIPTISTTQHFQGSELGNINTATSPYDTMYFADTSACNTGPPTYSPSEAYATNNGGFDFSTRFEEPYGSMHDESNLHPNFETEFSLTGLPSSFEDGMYIMKNDQDKRY